MAPTKRADPPTVADDAPPKKAKTIHKTAASSRPSRVRSRDDSELVAPQKPRVAVHDPTRDLAKRGSKAGKTQVAAENPVEVESTVKQKTRPKVNEGETNSTVAKNNSKSKDSKNELKHQHGNKSRKIIDTPGNTDEPENERSYWLMKAEPEPRVEKGVDVKFSIHDLEARNEPEPWDGVRNHLAKKNMQSMAKGDLAFFYHSNCKIPGIVGVMEIVGEHTPDESALDSKHPYYDPKESREKPKWCVVHVKHRLTFDSILPLKSLQQFGKEGQPLSAMQLLKMSRLSVSKVTGDQWRFILGEAGIQPESLKSQDS